MTQPSTQSLYDALVAFMATTKHQMFQIAAEYGLTSTQAFMLLLMKEDDNRTMSSFSALLGCDASNITGLVDGLERKGLLVRREHASDRRVKVVQLTGTGAETRSAIFERMASEKQRSIQACLSGDEIRQFTTLLNKITQNQSKGAASSRAE